MAAANDTPIYLISFHLILLVHMLPPAYAMRMFYSFAAYALSE